MITFEMSILSDPVHSELRPRSAPEPNALITVSIKIDSLLSMDTLAFAGAFGLPMALGLILICGSELLTANSLYISAAVFEVIPTNDRQGRMWNAWYRFCFDLMKCALEEKVCCDVPRALRTTSNQRVSFHYELYQSNFSCLAGQSNGGTNVLQSVFLLLGQPVRLPPYCGPGICHWSVPVAAGRAEVFPKPFVYEGHN